MRGLVAVALMALLLGACNTAPQRPLSAAEQEYNRQLALAFLMNRPQPVAAPVYQMPIRQPVNTTCSAAMGILNCTSY